MYFSISQLLKIIFKLMFDSGGKESSCYWLMSLDVFVNLGFKGNSISQNQIRLIINVFIINIFHLGQIRTGIVLNVA